MLHVFHNQNRAKCLNRHDQNGGKLKYAQSRGSLIYDLLKATLSGRKNLIQNLQSTSCFYNIVRDSNQQKTWFVSSSFVPYSNKNICKLKQDLFHQFVFFIILRTDMHDAKNYLAVPPSQSTWLCILVRILRFNINL